MIQTIVSNGLREPDGWGTLGIEAGDSWVTINSEDLGGRVSGNIGGHWEEFEIPERFDNPTEAIDAAICRLAQTIEEATAIKKALEAEYQRSLG